MQSSQKPDALTRLVSLVKRVTGKEVVWQDAIWCQHEDEICVPEADFEGLLHEFCHWLVASEDEKEDPNLRLVNGYGEDIYKNGKMRRSTEVDFQNSIRREMQACTIEMQLARETDKGSAEELESISRFGSLQYDESWWNKQTKQQRAGRLAHMTRTFNRYEEGLREEVASILGDYLSDARDSEGSP